MFAILVQLGRVLQLVHLAIDLDAGKTLAARRVKDIQMLALAPLHQRCEQLHLGAVGLLQNLTNNLLSALPCDRSTAFMAVLLANTCI